MEVMSKVKLNNPTIYIFFINIFNDVIKIGIIFIYVDFS